MTTIEITADNEPNFEALRVPQASPDISNALAVVQSYSDRTTTPLGRLRFSGKEPEGQHWLGPDGHIPEGARFIPLVGRTRHGHQWWLKKELLCEDVRSIAEELPDPQVHECSKRTPASYIMILPLIDAQSGEELQFSTASNGGIRSIQKVLNSYKNFGARFGKTPIVTLRSSSYEHSDFGRINTPLLKVEDWIDDPDAAPVVKQIAHDNSDLNDSINF
jgi:hypothetical protein